MRIAGPSKPLQSADTILRLLLLFREGCPVRVSDASAKLGVSPSSAHRMLATLKNQGFVRQDSRTRAYLVGEVLVELVQSRHAATRLVTAGSPVLETLALQTGESCHLAVLRGTKALFVAGAEGTETLRTSLHVAMTFPAHCTSSGKCLLAFLPLRELRARYAGQQITPLRKNGVRSWSDLLATLELARRRGYATSMEEAEIGVNSVAVPVLSHRAEPFGALVLTAPSSRLGSRKIKPFARQLQRAARSMTRTLSDAGAGPHGLYEFIDHSG